MEEEEEEEEELDSIERSMAQLDKELDSNDEGDFMVLS